MFAKLFETEEHGQILVKMDTAEDASGPEVREYFEPEGLGVCSVAFSWSDEDEDTQWEKAESTMEKADGAFCCGVVKGIKEKMLAPFQEGDE